MTRLQCCKHCGRASEARPEINAMKNKGKRKDLDGTGRHPKGDRAVRKLKGRLTEKFFREALAWVYRHLRYRIGGTLCGQAKIAGVDEETLSQMERGAHLANALTEMLVAETLGYHAEEVRALMRRWSRKLIGRKAAKA